MRKLQEIRRAGRNPIPFGVKAAPREIYCFPSLPIRAILASNWWSHTGGEDWSIWRRGHDGTVFGAAAGRCNSVDDAGRVGAGIDGNRLGSVYNAAGLVGHSSGYRAF